MAWIVNTGIDKVPDLLGLLREVGSLQLEKVIKIPQDSKIKSICPFYGKKSLMFTWFVILSALDIC